MILDDRPVIDQLLHPTPLNILDEVQSELHDMICDGADRVRESVDADLFTLLDMAPVDERDHAFDRIAQVAEAVAGTEVDRAIELLATFVQTLEARL